MKLSLERKSHFVNDEKEQFRETHQLDRANCLLMLADLYRKQDKYVEAEPQYLQALSIYEQEVEADHPLMATSLNALAFLYHQQRKNVEAEPLYLRALAMREHRLGTHHLDTAISLNNLAACYLEQGKVAEAEPF